MIKYKKLDEMGQVKWAQSLKFMQVFLTGY